MTEPLLSITDLRPVRAKLKKTISSGIKLAVGGMVLTLITTGCNTKGNSEPYINSPSPPESKLQGLVYASTPEYKQETTQPATAATQPAQDKTQSTPVK